MDLPKLNCPRLTRSLPRSEPVRCDQDSSRRHIGEWTAACTKTPVEVSRTSEGYALQNLRAFANLDALALIPGAAGQAL